MNPDTLIKGQPVLFTNRFGKRFLAEFMEREERGEMTRYYFNVEGMPICGSRQWVEANFSLYDAEPADI